MAEKQRCQEGHRLCANNCGFLGSPATLNLCSKCYHDFRLKEEQAASAKCAVENSLIAATSSSVAATASSPSSSSSSSSPAPVAVTEPAGISSTSFTVASVKDAEKEKNTVVAPPPVATAPSRCTSCRKRVGLTGFKCRCGATYCGTHRYPEQHACTFDFKAAGREAIARANPVIKADKLYKI